LILSFYSGSLDFDQLIKGLTTPGSEAWKSAMSANFLGASALSWGLSLIFIGGAGKSAMFPLHIWLPDAMEGPTPVSALIHAATMVVAGVYLVARLFPLYSLSAPAVLDSIAWVGVISALLAALIACTQTDIKRILAYSTMSQIGFMMFALGSAGYGGEAGLGFTASMFHLFTHAMFKALLFLAAGVVIHWVHSNEVKAMGGLRKQLPVTHICFLIGCLSISGIPPFAGFFSKEEILLAASRHSSWIFWVGLVTSGLTAFYMFRMYFLIFWNKQAEPYQLSEKPQGEGGTTILLPIILLTIGAGLAGFIPFGNFVAADGIPISESLQWQFFLVPVGLGLAGIFLAWWLFKAEQGRPEKISASSGRIYKTIYHKFYIDEIYLGLTRGLVFNLVGRPAAWIDKHVVDGLVNLTGKTAQTLSEKIKWVQSGKVQQYAIYFLAGIVVLSLIFIYW
ncbi:MAG: NADH-quinone oxidoreductase subunit L, partial [Chitinophagales bacterium]